LRTHIERDLQRLDQHPIVAAGVIEVPVRVDELLDGIRIDAGESRRNFRPRGDDLGIDEKLSVRTSKNGDVSTGANQDADIVPKHLHRDLGCGGTDAAKSRWLLGCS
jgi:hypothetical protein